MFISGRWEYRTPQALFDRLDGEFHFTLDVCASDEIHMCDRYFTIETDGLKQDWSGEICWMNPPYGREIPKWMEKAYLSSKNGAIVVCLVPSRTDTDWWHRFVMKGEIRFVRKRICFNGKGRAPFPSAIIIFGERNE
jgi:phage N-6-adenine-methyltransferase